MGLTPSYILTAYLFTIKAMRLKLAIVLKQARGRVLSLFEQMRRVFVCAVSLLLTVANSGCDQGKGAGETVGVLKCPIAERSMDRVVISLSEDQKKAIEMRGKLDSGDVAEALKIARVLMDSRESSVRGEVVTVFGWIGKRCISELTEMLVDKDPEIASEALTAWEMANEEEHIGAIRAENICTAISNLEDAATIDTILMQMTSLDEVVAVRALGIFITSSKNPIAISCAKEMFAHITGEIWESPNRANEIIQNLSRKG